MSARFYEPSTFLGGRVYKVGAADAAADDLFTVRGLNLITLWFGVVTNAIANSSIDIDLRIKTTNEALIAQTVIDNDPVGTIYLVSGDTGAALGGADAPLTRVGQLGGVAHSPLIIGAPGAANIIEQVITGTPNAGDAIAWTLFYFPLEPGAGIEAAA